MCYKLISHTLHCDVRPLIAVSDHITKPLIDPYAAPEPCHCKDPDLTIRPHLRCDFGHKCCYMTSMHFPCDQADCQRVVLFHGYTRRNISRDAYLERGPAGQDEGWAPLPSIDDDVYDLEHAPVATERFIQARSRFLWRAKGLYEVLSKIREFEAETRQRRVHLLSREHGTCVFLEDNWERVCGYPTGNVWDCRVDEDLEDLERGLEVMEEVADRFRGRVLDAYFRMVELEEAREGDIRGLNAWG